MRSNQDVFGHAGSKLNKVAMKPRAFYRVRIGHMMQFGASSRMFLLTGPPEVAEEEEVRVLHVLCRLVCVTV